MKIISRFRILISEKETREHRRISLQKVSEETGISIYTIKKLNADDLKEFPMEAMVALCRYFACTPGDLFIQESTEAGRLDDERKMKGNTQSPIPVAA